MRVIQDSDDEFDDDLEVDIAPATRPDASEEQPTNNPSRSGGSTESLKRAIEQAHRAHLQSQPSQNEPQSSVSLPEHPNKRRKTSAEVNPRNLPAIVSPVADRLANDATDKTAPVNQIGWSLEGTMRDNYAHHDPMALFPEPSSTVPNATFTQKRVLEGLMAPTMLGDSEVEASHYQPPSEPSVPWSDIIKFSPATTGQQSESTNHEHTSSNVTTNDLLGAPQSQRSRPGSSTRLQDSSLSLQNEISSSNVDKEQVKGTSSEASPVEPAGILPTASSNTHRITLEEVRKSPLARKIQVDSVPSSNDDLAAVGLPREQYKPRPSRSRSLMVDNEQPIDYSARPEKAKRVSKRRKTISAPVDAGGITTPQKIRQICDMGFTPSTTESALEQNNGDVAKTVEWLVSNGVGEDELASHDTPRKSATSKGSHESSSVDYNTIQGIMRGLNEYHRPDSESVQHAVKSTQAASAVHQAESVNNNTKLSATDQPHNAAQIRSPKVQVVIPRNPPKTGNVQSSGHGEAPTKKPKRRKTTLDRPEPESHLEERIVLQTTEKKRGRGRHKKVVVDSARPADSTLEVPEECTQRGQHGEQLQKMESSLTAPPRTSVGTQLCTTSNGAQTREPDSRRDEAPVVESPLQKTPAPTASQTPGTLTKHASHSPNNKSKVPYRVGLSKRARIAPLLRMLKK